MPRYSYLCATCGSFDAMRPMAAYADPCDCQICGVSAPRELSAAGLAGVRSAGFAAPAGAASGRHRSGCGCCTPPLRTGLRAEAVAAGAPKRVGAAVPAGSFLTRD